MNLNLIKISMTTLTIKEAVLLEDHDPNGIKLYWAKAKCDDPYLDIDYVTGGIIKHLGGGGYLIITRDNLIPGHEISIIDNFNIDSDNIRTWQELWKQ